MGTIDQKDERVRLAIEIFIRISLLALVIYFTYLIAKPFIGIVIWGIIIAVALSPLITMLEKQFGNRKKVIMGFTITVIAALLIPTYMLSGSMIEASTSFAHAFKEGNITIPPPTQKVKEWPVIGEQAYAFWDSASHNLKTTLEPFKDEIKKMAGKFFSVLGSGLSTILMFVGSFVIAAAFLIKSEGAVMFYRTVLRRIIGEKGDEWATLSSLTVRSVVTGVIGVAVIQALLAFIGLIAMDIPFAVVWTLIIMFFTIIQMPALIVIGPIIAYVFAHGSGTAEIVFAIYMLIVGAVDGVLKPLLMGRGVDIPMLIILIGAIGGMILMGLIGLFIGAVVFALAYKLFGLWIADAKEKTTRETIQNA